MIEAILVHTDHPTEIQTYSVMQGVFCVFLQGLLGKAHMLVGRAILTLDLA